MAEQLVQETSVNKVNSALSTAALVLGIIAAVLGWTGPLGLALAILAIIFGVLGVIRKQDKVKSIWGMALGGVALVTALIVISVAAAVVKEVTDNGTPTLSDKTNTSESRMPAIFKVGDAINFDDKKVTVTNVERNWASGNQFITPDNANEFVKVQVSIENNSKTQVSYNTFDWKMQDSQGVIKDIDSSTYSVDGSLSSGELAPAGKVSGFMIFQVPVNDSQLVISYNPSFFTEKKIEIKL